MPSRAERNSNLFSLFIVLPLLLACLTGPAQAAHYAYIANNGNSTVSKLPMSGGGVVGVGSRPYGVAASPDGKYFYATNFADATLSRIVADTCVVDRTITVGNNPWGVAASPDGKYVYVANNSDGTVSRVDAATGLEDKTITVGNNPRGVAVSPDGKYVYVANRGSGNVSRIDTSTGLEDKTTTVGSSPNYVAVSPDGKYVYVTNANDRNVSVIDASLETPVEDRTIGVGNNPEGVAVSPDGKYVYVANGVSNNVTRIDTSDDSTANINVGTQPYGVAVSPDGNYVYVANSVSDNVTRIDTSDNSTVNINVGNYPLGVAVSPDSRYLAVVNYHDDTVSIIDLALRTLPVGAGPLGVAAGPNGQYAWVSNNTAGTVSKVNVATDTVEATINVGNAPYGLAVTPDGKYVFVANSADDTVSRINTALGAVDSTINVGDDPRGVSITPDGVYVIVANFGDNTITRITVAFSSAMVVPTLDPLSNPISLGDFITPEVRGGPGNDDEGDDEELDPRPPGGPPHQIGGGGNNMDPPIPPGYTWTGDSDNGTLQSLTMALLHTGESSTGASAETKDMDIQVPGLMFKQTCPTGEISECWLALGEAGTTPGGVEYSTSMRWNYDVRVIDVHLDWPQSLLKTMATGKHCLTYWLQTEDGRRSNCRVGYLDLNPDAGTASVSLESGAGVPVPRSSDQLTFKVQLSYFNKDTGMVDRVAQGMCNVETDEGSWGSFPITDGMCEFTIPFGVTSEIGFNSMTFNGTKTVRIEFRDGFMYAFDQDHRDATVEVYQCVDRESYAIEYYQDLVYICNQGADPDGPILGRMFGK